MTERGVIVSRGDTCVYDACKQHEKRCELRRNTEYWNNVLSVEINRMCEEERKCGYSQEAINQLIRDAADQKMAQHGIKKVDLPCRYHCHNGIFANIAPANGIYGEGCQVKNCNFLHKDEPGWEQWNQTRLDKHLAEIRRNAKQHTNRSMKHHPRKPVTNSYVGAGAGSAEANPAAAVVAVVERPQTMTTEELLARDMEEEPAKYVDYIIEDSWDHVSRLSNKWGIAPDEIVKYTGVLIAEYRTNQQKKYEQIVSKKNAFNREMSNYMNSYHTESVYNNLSNMIKEYGELCEDFNTMLEYDGERIGVGKMTVDLEMPERRKAYVPLSEEEERANEMARRPGEGYEEWKARKAQLRQNWNEQDERAVEEEFNNRGRLQCSGFAGQGLARQYNISTGRTEIVQSI